LANGAIAAEMILSLIHNLYYFNAVSLFINGYTFPSCSVSELTSIIHCTPVTKLNKPLLLD